MSEISAINELLTSFPVEKHRDDENQRFARKLMDELRNGVEFVRTARNDSVERDADIHLTFGRMEQAVLGYQLDVTDRLLRIDSALRAHEIEAEGAIRAVANDIVGLERAQHDRLCTVKPRPGAA